MKKTNSLLISRTFLALWCALAHGLLFAQATKESETSTNQVLLENSAKAQVILQQQNTGKPVQEIRMLDGSKPPPSELNMTDQDRQLSENYMHQGMANDIIKEKCAGKMGNVCSGQEGNHKFLGMDPMFMKVAAQAYATIGALSSDFLPLSKGTKLFGQEGEKGAAANSDEAKATEEADANKKKEPANDYCKYIPTITEGLAATIQAAKSMEMSNQMGNGDTAQKDLLLKAAKSHDSRAKMAQIQAAGWWGGAACYGASMAAGQFAMDKNLAIKLGAAALLGAFYQNEVSANKAYADKTRSIANSLPGKGDCNPITENLCYCSQPSTENDPVYCAKGLHAKALAKDSYRIACTDDHLKIDPTCACEASNSCFDRYLENQGAGSLQLGLGYGTSPFKSIRSLARGELVGGVLNSQSYDQTAALAKRALRDVASKIPGGENSLTKDQQALAKSMMEQGLPANVARLVAQNPVSKEATDAALLKFSTGSAGKMAEYAPGKKSNIVDFSGGNALGYKGQVKGVAGDGANDLLAKLKGGEKTLPLNSKILEFSQRAEAQARNSGQIRQNDTPLFEIISLRYQISGRKLLQVDK